MKQEVFGIMELSVVDLLIQSCFSLSNFDFIVFFLDPWDIRKLFE